MNKIHCYVDESGQHSRGKYFLVSIVIADDKQDKLGRLLVKAEKESGKGKLKWAKSKDSYRHTYIRAILLNPLFKGLLYSAYYESTQEYVDLTIKSTAKAIQEYTSNDYRATIVVDGLRKNERNRFATGLRREGVRTHKVRGTEDEKDPFIRLADALCGFVADAIQGREEFKLLMEKAERDGMLKLLT